MNSFIHSINGSLKERFPIRSVFGSHPAEESLLKKLNGTIQSAQSIVIVSVLKNVSDAFFRQKVVERTLEFGTIVGVKATRMKISI